MFISGLSLLIKFLNILSNLPVYVILGLLALNSTSNSTISFPKKYILYLSSGCLTLIIFKKLLSKPEPSIESESSITDIPLQP